MSLKTLTKWGLAVLVVIIVVTMGASAYMLHYALAPDPGRTDTTACFQRQFEEYPETKGWVDSLRRCNALRDTFVTMPTGERHHALFIRQASNKTAVVLHGWRSCSIDVLFLARIYERVLGYNVVVPDFHGHGLSEGDDIQMGWLERNDIICWMRTFLTDTMVVHGVSMGGAAALVLSGEQLPKEIRDIRFVDDCGYTNVWDELEGELKNQFGLPAFPLMYTSDLLCKLSNGWGFKEASALRQVAHASNPILFIHGEKDTFVPTEMAYRLFSAKPEPKELWISKGSEHALSYKDHKDEYIQKMKNFLIIGGSR